MPAGWGVSLRKKFNGLSVILDVWLDYEYLSEPHNTTLFMQYQYTNFSKAFSENKTKTNKRS